MNGENDGNGKKGNPDRDLHINIEAVARVSDTKPAETGTQKASSIEGNTQEQHWVRRALLEFSPVITAVATVVIMAATIGYTRYAGRQYKTMQKQLKEMGAANVITRDVLESSTRAWIAPGSASLDEALTIGGKISVTITYGNPGREPARNFIMSPPFSDVIPLPPEGWKIFPFGENKTCEMIQSVEGGPSIFPAGPHDFQAHYISADEKKVAREDLVSGASGLLIMGCFQYDTFHKHRRSAFCFYLDPEKGVDSKKWRFKFCPRGNYAD